MNLAELVPISPLKAIILFLTYLIENTHLKANVKDIYNSDAFISLLSAKYSSRTLSTDLLRLRLCSSITSSMSSSISVSEHGTAVLTMHSTLHSSSLLSTSKP